MDFSRNISGTPKYEVQSAYFNKRQHSLHVTVAHESPEKNKYFYHLSDDMTHDFAFTGTVVKDTILQYKDLNIIRLKLDNCAVQYKLKKVFGFWRNLAKEIKKPIVVYYGVAGHGKGLVDAASGFGNKVLGRKKCK